MCTFLLHQMLTSVESSRKKILSGTYLEKCHTILPLTFNTEEYTGDGGDSLQKKGLHTFCILEEAFWNFETDKEETMCLHSFVHLFDKY